MNFERGKGNYGLVDQEQQQQHDHEEKQEEPIVDTERAENENEDEDEDEELHLIGSMELEHSSLSLSSLSSSSSRRIPISTLLLMCLIVGFLAFSAGKNGIFSGINIYQTKQNNNNSNHNNNASSGGNQHHTTTTPPTTTTPIPTTAPQPTDTAQSRSTEPTKSTQTFSATTATAATTSTSTDNLPACNANQLLRVVAKSEWRYKTAEELDHPPYGNRCRFLYPRYNCDKGSNTANDMVLEYSQTEMKSLGCHVPRYDVAMDQLIEQNRNLFLCGDSHIAEIYLDMLCTFQSQIHKVDYIEHAMHTVEVSPSEVQADGAESLPVCSSGLARKIWGSPAIEDTGENCIYYKASPPAAVCATFKQQSLDQESNNNNNKDSNDTNAAVICLMYTRPIGDAAGAKLCAANAASGVPVRHGLGNISDDATSNQQPNRTFHTVFANTYVDQQVLGESLDAVGFQGKYVLINKNNAGSQMMVSVQTANEHSRAPAPFKVDTTTFDTGDLSMEVLDTLQISNKRTLDAYAVTLPFTGHSGGSASREVCCAYDKSACVCDVEGPLAWTDVRTCRNVARDVGLSTCLKDGHLCMPGIVTDIVSNLFSVALTP